MTTSKPNQNKVTTPVFRMSFPSLFVASAMKNEKGEPEGTAKFSLVMLFDAAAQATPEFAKLKDLAKAAAADKWGPDYKKKMQNLRNPIRDGLEKEHLEGYGAGVLFTSASTMSKPGIVDGRRQPVTDVAEVYPGRRARATVTAFAYDKKGNRGVAFSLHNVQLLTGGDSLAGRARAQDDFEDADEAWESEDGDDF